MTSQRQAYPEAYPSEHPGYGAIPPRKKSGVSVLGVLLFVLLPFALFVALFSISCFFRYNNPGFYVASYIASFALIMLVFGQAALSTQIRPEKRRRIQEQGQRYTQSLIGLVTMTVAYLMAFYAGNINYTSNMKPWFQMTDLQTYNPVDVATARGQQHMDAGRMYFTDTAKVDTTKMKAFKSGAWYCVAPVVSDDSDVDFPYDFWAAGRDCCASGEWHCGQWNNPKAHAGLRHPLDADVDYFRLAVKQAQISFGVKVDNPIFLTWLQDPETEISEYSDAGEAMYRTMLVVAAVVNVVLIIALYFLMFARISLIWSEEDREEEIERLRDMARHGEREALSAWRFAQGER